MTGQKVHKPSAFISIPEEDEKIGEKEIKDGLASPDLNTKEKFLKILITYILNNESFP